MGAFEKLATLLVASLCFFLFQCVTRALLARQKALSRDIVLERQSLTAHPMRRRRGRSGGYNRTDAVLVFPERTLFASGRLAPREIVAPRVRFHAAVATRLNLESER